MKRTTLIKAVAGAGALFILGTGVAYAGDSTDNKINATVTVTAQQSLTLSSTGSTFAVANTAPIYRNAASPTALVQGTDTFSLSYITDTDGDYVDVKADDVDSAAFLGATKITLNVSPGTVVAGGTGTAPTPQAAALTSASAGTLLPGINGNTVRNQHSFSPLTFTAQAGKDAVIGGDQVVLLFAIHPAA